MTPGELGAIIVQRYIEAYEGTRENATQSAIDLTKLDDLVEAVDQLAAKLLAALPNAQAERRDPLGLAAEPAVLRRLVRRPALPGRAPGPFGEPARDPAGLPRGAGADGGGAQPRSSPRRIPESGSPRPAG